MTAERTRYWLSSKAVWLSILVGVPAQASHWVHVGRNSRAAQVYIDRASVLTSGSEVTYWEKITSVLGDLTNQITIDCGLRTYRTMYMVRHDPKGTLVESFATAPTAHPIPPDSLAEEEARTVCGPKLK